MAYFIPSSIQKRLLRYALSKLELLDTDDYDLENLDITLGRKNNVELQNVGLKTDKLAALLSLPPALRLDVAKVLLLRITVQADIWNPSIQIELRGVRVAVHLDTKQRHAASDRRRRRGSSTGVKDALPTTSDIARSFLAEEPVQEKRELEDTILSQSRGLDGSDHVADDGSGNGTGVAMALPSFLANYLQGVQDRLQVSISDVEFELKAEVPGLDINLNTSQTSEMSVILHCDTLGLEGITGEDESASEAKASHSGKRHIALKQLAVKLVSDASFFASLSRAPSVSSRSPSQPRSPTVPRSDSSRSGIRSTTTSPPSRSSVLPHRRRSSASFHGACSRESAHLQRRGSLEALLNRRPTPSRSGQSMHSSDDNISMGSSMHSAQANFLEDSQQSFLGEQIGHEYAGQEIGGESGFLDSSGQHSLQQSIDDLPVGSDAFFHHRDLDLRTSPRPGLRRGPLSATFPRANTPAFSNQSPDRLEERPVSRSQPTAGRASLGQMFDATSLQPTATANDIVPERSSSSASDSSQSSSAGSGGLAESKLFTHEDAESMYMSAFSETSGGELRDTTMPGGWSSHEETGSAYVASTGSPQASFHSVSDQVDNEEAATPRATSPMPSTTRRPESEAASPPLEDPVSPPAQKTVQHESAAISSARVGKQILSVSSVDLWIPATRQTDNEDSQQMDADFTQQDNRLSSLYRPLPGAFSIHQASDQSKILPSHLSSSQSFMSGKRPQEHTEATLDDSTEAHIGPVQLDLDMSIARVAFGLVTQVREAFEDSTRREKTSANTQEGSTDPALPLFRVFVDQLSLHFLEHVLDLSNSCGNVESSSELPASGTRLFRLDMYGLDVSSRANNEMQAVIKTFTVGLQKDQVLSFDPPLNSVSSVKESQHQDVQICYKPRSGGAELTLMLQPVRLDVNVLKIDETLSCFGGLSGVLELSNSMSSASAPISTPVKAIPQRSRGVRFAGERETLPATPLAGWKINAHIRGFTFLLTGQTCGLSLETTSIKVVGRERGISTSFNQLRLAGPYFDATDTLPPLNIQLDGTRVDFLFTPEETDLTNLVSLITPSRDKYNDDDDDILLDTLLRQRQKGSLIRVNITMFHLDITELAAVQKLQSLGEELSKIQNVAKYLPEDDRPGMLAMLTIRGTKAKISLDNAMRLIQVETQGLRLGHVGIPPLLALSIDSMSLMHGSSSLLITEVLRKEVVDLPMLMVRIISDEMIPTIKIKLNNLCAEYRVQTIIDMMGLVEGASVEDLSASIVTSVATITHQASNTWLRETSSDDGAASRAASKSIHVEILFRGCAIGLNPRSSPSKALFLLSDAKVLSKLPADATYSASLDIRKAYLLLVDDTANLSKEVNMDARSGAVGLCQLGYVSVGTMSRAHFSVRSWEDEGRTRLTEVNVSNELFVMESCADSTQTLIGLFGALAPPSPPNRSERYRTEVVPMEDMMASFSGEPVVGSQDVVAQDEDEDDDFDLPVDMIGSFYAPDELEDDLEAEVLDTTTYDDGLSMLKSVRPVGSINSSDLSELGERCRVLPHEQAFLYEENYYGKQAGTKGMARKWGSAKNEYGIASETKIAKSPLRVHLSDLHFIWNLFDGYDWAKTRQTIEKAVHEVEVKAEERRREKRLSPDQEDVEDEVIGDFLFNSIWIEVPANKDPRELARNINHDVDDLASETGSYATMTTHTHTTSRSSGPQPRRKRLRLQRSRHRKITFELKGVAADVYVFAPDSDETQSSIDVRVGDLEIFDHVPSSTWKKFATYMKDAGEREMGKPMIRLELLDVKPVEGLAASESVLRVSVLPLRLHVDQDALDFITRFFEFKEESSGEQAPAGPQPFIQRIEVNTVLLKLDYKPKKVDYAGIRSGHTTEFMNFFILDDCDIVLRHCIIYGVSGFDKLHKTLNDIWMPDVQRNQLPTVLSGLAAVRPLVNVTSGVRDLIYIPLREYKKDGRVVRSVQKGAVAFARTTTSELARLGAKLAIGTQNVLQGAEEILTPTPSGTPRRRDDTGWDDTSYPFSTSPSHAHDESEERRATSNYANQPIGVVAGLRSAARSLERDLLTARDAIVAIPGEVMESGSAGGAVGVVARRAPTVILRTARGASKAVGVALLGAGNALDAESRRRIEDKYKQY